MNIEVNKSGPSNRALVWCVLVECCATDKSEFPGDKDARIFVEISVPEVSIVIALRGRRQL